MREVAIRAKGNQHFISCSFHQETMLAAKRENSRVARKRELLRYNIILGIVCLLAMIFLYNQSFAKDGQAELSQREKYYTSIVVMKGETLDSLYNQYSSPEYSDAEAYKSEVIQINHLNAEGKIHTGNYLILPYYK
ncbi:MAG: hypothetical protein K5989_00240 [Lachnospiraceae bacterium]|nr:hypothetical protein [Lachnospiraceae bacterium]